MFKLVKRIEEEKEDSPKRKTRERDERRKDGERDRKRSKGNYIPKDYD